MQLIYLYIENYKNIKSKGFNFTTQFKCDYKNGTLTIDKNENYIENFFGDNIEVSAIVGENGSGKSSVFEVLTFLYYQGVIVNREDKTFFLFYENETFFIQCENIKLKNINLEDFIKIKNHTSAKMSKEFCARGDMPLIHFSNCISDITHNYSLKTLKNYDKFYNGIQPTKPLMKSENSYDNFNQKFQYVLKQNNKFFNFIDEAFIFDSYQCEIQLQEIEASIVQYDNKEFSEYISFQKKKNLTKEELLYKMLIVLAIEMTITKIHNSRHHSLEPNTANAEVLKKYIKENIEDKLINKVDEFHLFSLKFTLETCNKSLKQIDESISEELFDINLFSTYFQWEPQKPINNFHEFFDDVQIDQSNTIFQSHIFKMENNYLEIIYNNELLNFMMNNNILRCNFLNSKKNNCHFLELSSGEKLFLNLLTNFAYTLFRLSNDYKGVMLFDEIELSFHPNWQKRLLKSLVYIYNDITRAKKLHLHLILTSHSPFILSDIPRQNIVFLKDGKQVDALEKKQTFGANIHTLLADGFFMDGGLMGEFAKEKIEEVIKFLNNDKSKIKDKKEVLNLIDIIGEPFLKQKLQDMYFKKFNDNSIDEQIKKLERQIERLKNVKS